MTQAPASEAPPAAPIEAAGGGTRWLGSIAGACLAAAPIGWLLSYAALLPFFIGLFFFVLFGLVLGAIAYRLGSPCRPLPKNSVVAGAAAIVVLALTISVLNEARVFPAQLADIAINHYKKLPEGTTPQQFKAESIQQITDYLKAEYSPGGVIGYIRWSIQSGRLQPPIAHLQRPFKAKQPGAWWLVRVILSITLLTYGVYTQVGPLTRPATVREREGTRVNPLSKI